MQDAFAYCAGLVRDADRDRFLASLFAPAEHRGALHALYAFDGEIARIRDIAREAMPGEIRLQWWREVVEGERSGEASANPVSAALMSTVERYGLPASELIALLDARSFDLYDEPMASIGGLEAYLARTSSTVIALAAKILGIEAAAAAGSAGIAYGLAGLIRAFPLHAARHQLYLPATLLERHGVDAHEIFAGHSSPSLNAAVGDLRGLARSHLAAARAPIVALAGAVIPAFLPVAPVRASLDRLDHDDALAPVELSPWRRQWLIWRAARNPARIAG